MNIALRLPRRRYNCSRLLLPDRVPCHSAPFLSYWSALVRAELRYQPSLLHPSFSRSRISAGGRQALAGSSPVTSGDPRRGYHRARRDCLTSSKGRTLGKNGRRLGKEVGRLRAPLSDTRQRRQHLPSRQPGPRHLRPTNAPGPAPGGRGRLEAWRSASWVPEDPAWDQTCYKSRDEYLT